MLKQLLKKPLAPFLIFMFVVCSWPFIYYPLTDGDIGNWVWVSMDMLQTGNFLNSANDQGHGPILAWTGAFFSALIPKSFYPFAFFNILVGVFGAWLTFFFSNRLWNNVNIAKLATLMYCTSLMPIYLTRTPMYDWPATIFFFAYCCFYTLSIKEKKPLFHLIALLCIGIGSMNRLSICLGLAGFYVIFSNLILRRPLWHIIKDGLFLTASIVAFNAPWLYAQTTAFGSDFLKTMIYDNTGRYVKSTRPNATFQFDFYAFPLYTLIGLMPYTFCFMTTVFQKKFLKRLKENQSYLLLLAGFLPALILFSFSGHTKLARYIAYVFPFIHMLVAHNLYTYDLDNESYRKKASKYTNITAIGMGAILLALVIVFWTEVTQAWGLAIAIIILVYGQLKLASHALKNHSDTLKNNPEFYLKSFAVLYIPFFTVLAYYYQHAEFLTIVRDRILRYIMI